MPATALVGRASARQRHSAEARDEGMPQGIWCGQLADLRSGATSNRGSIITGSLPPSPSRTRISLRRKSTSLIARRTSCIRHIPLPWSTRSTSPSTPSWVRIYPDNVLATPNFYAAKARPAESCRAWFREEALSPRSTATCVGNRSTCVAPMSRGCRLSWKRM